MKHDFYCYTQALAIGYSVPLLENIEIGVDRGEILTLIGPNGAGKSTLLKTLASQLAAQGGAVYLDGQGLASLSGRDRAKKMALMLPHTRRAEWTSCFDFASAGRYPYTGRLGVLSGADRAAVTAALELVGAADLADRDFNCISDGQRQRVLLARAICQQPELILLDEPTSFLDIKGKIELLSILKRLAREQNVAVIMSLHELDLAQKVSDKVVCVSSDGVTAPAAPEAVFTADNIRRLYGVTAGSYEPLSGAVELERPEGEPTVFVIGGAGRGIPVYRRLQRAGTAFCAGIIYQNDLDAPVAAALAAEVVWAAAFEPVGEAAEARARALIDKSTRVVCCEQSVGEYNAANRRLAAYAAASGKQVSDDAL